MKNNIKIETVLNQIFDNEIDIPTDILSKLKTKFDATIEDRVIAQVFDYEMLCDELSNYENWTLSFHSTPTDYYIGDVNISELGRFADLFDRFKFKHLNQYNRVFYATVIDYNPMENYEKHSDVRTTRTGTEDNAHTGTIGVNGFVTTPTLTNTNSVTTESGSTFNDTDKITMGGGKTENSNTTTMGNNDTLTLNSNETVVDSTHGNIGVMTFDKMGMGEYEWRKLRLFSDLVREFILKYGYYVKGVDNEQDNRFFGCGITDSI